MQKFIDWLTNVLAPKAQKFFNKPYIAGVSSAMTKVLPFILAGSIVYVYGVFQGFFPTVLPNLTFLLIFSFRMLGLITAFYVGHQIMEKLEMPQYSIIAGITSILMFIMFIKPEMDGIATATFQFGRFGPTGMFVSIAAGVLVAIVFHLIGKLHILEDNDTVPVFIQEWIRNTIPVFLSVCVGYTLSYGLNLDVYQIIMNLFAPISNFL